MSPTPPENPLADRPVVGASFRTTHWSAVLLAGLGDSPGSWRALEDLCQAYWYPLYAYVRRKGYATEDAQDLVQGFFEMLLRRRDLALVHPAKGLFRSFLLGSLNHFLANQWDRSQAAKRGGRGQTVPLEGLDPENRYRHEPVDNETPENLYERAWAQRLLERVLGRLRQESVEGDRLERFECLKEFRLGDREGTPYAELATRLGMTEPGIKSAVHRLRQRFRELFRDEIALTVSGEHEIDDELRHLARVMAR